MPIRNSTRRDVNPADWRFANLKRKVVILILILTIWLTACSQVPQETVTIRVGVLPVLDTLPMYVARAQGYFDAEGVQVEFVPVNAAPERDQLMQSGQIDAMLNEIVSVLLFNKNEPRIVAVRFARIATEKDPVFRIVASADSRIISVEDLRGVPIGISEGTVIEYTTDRILEHAGFSADMINKLAVPKIPDRLNLLATGQLEAANLPDPAASLAMLNGARLIIDDRSYPEISHSVISFSRDFIREHPDAVRAFLRAIETAVIEINADKDAWDVILTENNLIPPPLLESYTLPDYPTAGVPSERQFADALYWLRQADLITDDIAYEFSVDSTYLP
jgi:NitT/TauT family transport system substrate-binding protein